MTYSPAAETLLLPGGGRLAAGDAQRRAGYIGKECVSGPSLRVRLRLCCALVRRVWLFLVALARASDLSTRWQRMGHAMVTTGTEDKSSILESGPERLLILLRKAAGAQRSHWTSSEGVRGHMNGCTSCGQFKWVCRKQTLE